MTFHLNLRKTLTIGRQKSLSCHMGITPTLTAAHFSIFSFYSVLTHYFTSGRSISSPDLGFVWRFLGWIGVGATF
jgi:hypothetical protein